MIVPTFLDHPIAALPSTVKQKPQIIHPLRPYLSAACAQKVEKSASTSIMTPSPSPA